jgi:hypothetical protein
VRWRSLFLVASSLLCVSCGPISKLPPLASEEVEAATQTASRPHPRLLAQRGRLNNVAFRIRAANHRDCKNRSAQIGLDAGTVPSLPRKFRSYSHEALSVSWTRATVLSVAETSPAAAGGIKPGDQLMTFNNEAVPGSETVEWISRFVRERPIHVLVRRDGIEETRHPGYCLCYSGRTDYRFLAERIYNRRQNRSPHKHPADRSYRCATRPCARA